MEITMSEKQRILFIDDEPNFLNGLRRILRSRRDKWDMYFIDGVDDAITALTENTFDIIISDLNMPGKSGIYFLKLLHFTQKTKDTPIVILTGLNKHALKRQVLKLGATDLLTKPINKEDLIARIESLLRLKSLQDELKSTNKILKRKVSEQSTEIDRSHLDTIWKLAKAAECRDKQTGNHIMRVGYYSRVIAEKLGESK